MLARQPVACAPQAVRIQAADDHPALMHQHTRHLAQRGVRVGVLLQGVWQGHQVQARLGKRQGRKVGEQGGVRRRLAGIVPFRPCAFFGRFQRQPAVRHTVGRQGVKGGHTQLQRVVAKRIDHGLVVAGALPLAQPAAVGRLPPAGGRPVVRLGRRARLHAARPPMHRRASLPQADAKTARVAN